MSLVKTYPLDKLIDPKDLVPTLIVSNPPPSTLFSNTSLSPKPKVKEFRKLKDISLSQTQNPYPFLYFSPPQLEVLDYQDSTTYYNDIPLLEFQSIDPTTVVAITIHEHIDGGSITVLTGLYHFLNMNSLTVVNQHELTYFDVPKLPLLTYVIASFNGLTSFDISNNTYINHVDCSYNALIDVNISGATSLTFFDAGVCELTEQSVNHVLSELDAYDNIDGFIDLSGGTNAAPSGVGLTAIDNLLAKGWTVTTN